MSLYITQNEAARLCRMSQANIARLVTIGIIASDEFKNARHGVIRRIRRPVLEAFVAAGCPRPAMGRPRTKPLGPPGPRASRRCSEEVAKLPTHDFISQREASSLLGRSQAYIMSLCNKGIISTVIIPASSGLGRRRIKRADFAQFLQTRHLHQGEFISQREAARLIGRSRKIVARLCDDGTIPTVAVKSGGGREIRRIKRSDLPTDERQ